MDEHNDETPESTESGERYGLKSPRAQDSARCWLCDGTHHIHQQGWGTWDACVDPSCGSRRRCPACTPRESTGPWSCALCGAGGSADTHVGRLHANLRDVTEGIAHSESIKARAATVALTHYVTRLNDLVCELEARAISRDEYCRHPHLQ